MKKENPGALGDILKGVVSDIGKKKAAGKELARAWNRAAGKRAARHTKAVALRRSVLVVNVDASGWLYELTLKKKAVLKKVQGLAPDRKIKEVRLRIGDIKSR